MASPVKYLHSAMQGAPVVSNGFGDLIAMLDAALVNGFNLKTIDGITRSGSVATANISAGHLYEVGSVVTVAGADQAEYNGEQTITEVTASSFSYAVTGTPATPATTGTALSAKTSPLGFATAFTGTNKRVYRSPNVAGSRPFIRVDGAQLAGYGAGWAKFCRVTVAENMSGIDTFVGTSKMPFDPLATTKNEVRTGAAAPYYYGWFKWYSATSNSTDENGDGGAGARSWAVVGDDRAFYLFIAAGLTDKHTVYAVGEFNSYKAGDAYNSWLWACEYYGTSQDNVGYPGWQVPSGYMGTEYTGNRVLKDYTGLGNCVNASNLTLHTAANGTSGYDMGVPYPNGPDFSLQLHPIYVRQEQGHLRGTLPGAFAVLHDEGGLPSHGSVISNVVGYTGRKFVLLSFSGDGNWTGRMAFDITGPWR